MIKYSLHQNMLTPNVEMYRALVQSAGTLDMNHVVKTMVERGTPHTEAGTAAVLKDFFNAIEYLLLYGFRVSTPMGIYGLSIHGNFDSQLDGFDPNRHQLDLVIIPTRQAVRSLQGQAQMQKQAPRSPEPRPLQYINPNNGDGNHSLTPGGGAQVMGEQLSFDQSDPNQGIFLLGDNQSSTRVEVVMRNTSSELIFITPASLAAGTYQLEVRSLFGTNLRRGLLSQPLSVA